VPIVESQWALAWPGTTASLLPCGHQPHARRVGRRLAVPPLSAQGAVRAAIEIGSVSSGELGSAAIDLAE
jgi:hypothetical protein